MFDTPSTDVRHPVDIAVGANIRARRKFLHKSQEDLANALDLTFQQVQKYEKGSNRVAANVLFRIARHLHCTVADLFAGCDEAEKIAATTDADAPAAQSPAFTSWIDQARRVEDLRPGLTAKLSTLNRPQLDAIERIVAHIVPTTGTQAMQVA